MFGATVTLMDEDTDDKVKYRIVGEIEADVRSGKISITSPLARALLGKRNARFLIPTGKGHVWLSRHARHAHGLLPGWNACLTGSYATERAKPH